MIIGVGIDVVDIERFGEPPYVAHVDADPDDHGRPAITTRAAVVPITRP